MDFFLTVTTRRHTVFFLSVVGDVPFLHETYSLPLTPPCLVCHVTRKRPFVPFCSPFPYRRPAELAVCGSVDPRRVLGLLVTLV